MLFLAVISIENEPTHESAMPSENGGVRVSIALLLPFLVSAEALPSKSRGFGLTIVGLTSHASCFLMVLCFLLLEKGINEQMYALFALVMISVTLRVVKWLLKTKGRTL